MVVPRVIHQLWKDHAVPDRYRPFRDTWARLHPGWEMRLWTDRDLLELVERDYPHLLAVFRGYRHNICRADLGRYLLLHRFGGVYADLDCECLKPVGPLIDGASFAIGLEPDAHLAFPEVATAGFDRLLCPSFIASEPGHDFWRPVLDGVVERRDAEDPLEATGPYLLTRIFDRYPDQSFVRILPAKVVYPIHKADCWSGRVHDIEFWERATREAHVLHYWDGGWFGNPVGSSGLPAQIATAPNRPASRPAGFDHGRASPKISCLMLSQGALEPAARAIAAFLDQTWPDKELVIVARRAGQPLLDHLRALDRPELRLIEAGAPAVDERLHDLARQAAKGPLICRWAEDDVHDPARLAVQYQVLKQTDAHACLMRRWLAWRPQARRLGVVDARPSPSSLMCLKEAAPSGPLLGGGADPIVATLLAEARVALFDLPRLCVHINPVGGLDDALAVQFEGERYEAVLAELAKRMPVGERLRRLEAAASDVDVRLFGHFTAATGLGAAARGSAAALAAAGVTFTAIDIPLIETHLETVPVPPVRRAAADGLLRPVNLVHTNPDALAQAVREGRSSFGPADRRRAFTVGVWAWETEAGIPPAWRASFALFDEIWAPSAHAAAAIAVEAPVPVVVMPLAVGPPKPVLGRAALGLPDRAFVFLFAFDATSNVERKNPAALIRAFRAAFPVASAEVLLVLKTKKLPEQALRSLLALAADRPDIRIVAEPWDSQRMAALLAACDAYVSLHRAEGFGLTLAEAMFYGKPVIATAYSGNMDFMSEETAYLVPWRPRMLDADDWPYRAGSVWADPDLEAAAALIAQVAANPRQAAAVGERASSWVKAHLSPDAIGARMKARLAPGALASPPPPAHRKQQSKAPPRVLILTPVKDARAYLPRYVELLRRLDHDPSRLSLALLESDSSDGTDQALAAELPDLRARFAAAQLHRFDYGFRVDGPRWAPAIQRRRREILARSRNRLLNAALGDEDWVLWLDVDLIDYPPDLLSRLLEAGKDIVVPYCVRADGRAYDLNTFRFSADGGGRDDPRHLLDGLFQPPRAAGRVYLDAFADQPMVTVDGVGGTALLVRADLHREGLMFPPFSYRGYIETEGLAMMARDMGYQCWGLPGLRIVHA